MRTRAALVAAAQQEFSANGYAATTARSIAQAAGVSTGTFYQYFVDKDAVLRELGRSRFEAIASHVLVTLARSSDLSFGEATVRSQLGEVVAAVVDYHQEDPGLHAVLTERRVHDPELDSITTAGEAVLIEKIAELLASWGDVADPMAT
ncbi:MAG: TetR/AcrR family transcriptional regulator, partial [Polyangiaceae bacterium]|nr:TetR/AcrR family transcriptional regulator [Polyangiaceae bacterium]